MLSSYADGEDYFDESLDFYWANPSARPNNGYLNYHFAHWGTPAYSI